jgi:hypothetical protein
MIHRVSCDDPSIASILMTATRGGLGSIVVCVFTMALRIAGSSDSHTPQAVGVLLSLLFDGQHLGCEAERSNSDLLPAAVSPSWPLLIFKRPR